MSNRLDYDDAVFELDSILDFCMDDPSRRCRWLR